MRRVLVTLCASMLIIGLVAAPAIAGGAEVLRFSDLPCNTGWDEETASDLVTGPGGPCQAVNVRTSDGGFRLVLHGQIPPDWMDEFIADGSPRSFAVGCLVNWGFIYADIQNGGVFENPVFSDSVRYFTPDGRMTEVCEPSR